MASCGGSVRFGSGNAQFQLPGGCCGRFGWQRQDCDSFNNRIQEFTASGNYIQQFGTAGTGNGQFQVPDYLTVHLSGSGFLDSSDHRVQQFDSREAISRSSVRTEPETGNLSFPLHRSRFREHVGRGLWGSVIQKFDSNRKVPLTVRNGGHWNGNLSIYPVWLLIRRGISGWETQAMIAFRSSTATAAYGRYSSVRRAAGNGQLNYSDWRGSRFRWEYRVANKTTSVSKNSERRNLSHTIRHRKEQLTGNSTLR